LRTRCQHPLSQHGWGLNLMQDTSVPAQLRAGNPHACWLLAQVSGLQLFIEDFRSTQYHHRLVPTRLGTVLRSYLKVSSGLNACSRLACKTPNYQRRTDRFYDPIPMRVSAGLPPTPTSLLRLRVQDAIRS
jgi:hypothetical protein